MVANHALNSQYCEFEEEFDTNASSVYLVTDNTPAHDSSRVRAPKGIIWLEGTVSVAF